MENKIKVFENKNIRTVWNEEGEDWYFSVVDIIEILTGTERPRKYWNDLKKKLTIEGSELSEKIGQLKMAAADGKMRETDIIYKTWAGKTAKEYKEYKGLCLSGR